VCSWGCLDQLMYEWQRKSITVQLLTSSLDIRLHHLVVTIGELSRVNEKIDKLIILINSLECVICN